MRMNTSCVNLLFLFQSVIVDHHDIFCLHVIGSVTLFDDTTLYKESTPPSQHDEGEVLGTGMCTIFLS